MTGQRLNYYELRKLRHIQSLPKILNFMNHLSLIQNVIGFCDFETSRLVPTTQMSAWR